MTTIQVQRQDEEDGESFEQIVLNGARAIIEDDTSAVDQTWESAAVDELITELENREAVPPEKSSGFTFAPVYDSKTRITTELAADVREEGDMAAKESFWDSIAKQNEEAQARRLAEKYGRGARSKATVCLQA
jgi:hypothetical protein